MYSLGLDIGTTYTSVALWRDGDVGAVPFHGERSLSAVVVSPDGQVFAGDAARALQGRADHVTITDLVDRIGDSEPILVSGTAFSAEQLVAALLRAVVEDMRQQLGQLPASITICHPGDWGTFKIDMLSWAVSLADLHPRHGVQLITQPEAVAVETDNRLDVPVDGVFAVHDFGARSFTASLMRRTDVGYDTLGEPTRLTRLGGDDIDDVLAGHVAAGSLADHADSISAVDLDVLRGACAWARELLSTASTASISVHLPDCGVDVERVITRAEFDDVVAPVLDETIDVLRRTVTSAGLSVDDVQMVVLVGGCANIPAVASAVRDGLGVPAMVWEQPELASARGAAWVAGFYVAEADPEADPAPTTSQGAASDDTVVGLFTPVVMPVDIEAQPVAPEPEPSQSLFEAVPLSLFDAVPLPPPTDEARLPPTDEAPLPLSDEVPSSLSDELQPTTAASPPSAEDTQPVVPRRLPESLTTAAANTAQTAVIPAVVPLPSTPAPSAPPVKAPPPSALPPSAPRTRGVPADVVAPHVVPADADRSDSQRRLVPALVATAVGVVVLAAAVVAAVTLGGGTAPAAAAPCPAAQSEGPWVCVTTASVAGDVLAVELTTRLSAPATVAAASGAAESVTVARVEVFGSDVADPSTQPGSVLEIAATTSVIAVDYRLDRAPERDILGGAAFVCARVVALDGSVIERAEPVIDCAPIVDGAGTADSVSSGTVSPRTGTGGLTLAPFSGTDATRPPGASPSRPASRSTAGPTTGPTTGATNRTDGSSTVRPTSPPSGGPTASGASSEPTGPATSLPSDSDPPSTTPPDPPDSTIQTTPPETTKPPETEPDPSEPGINLP